MTRYDPRGELAPRDVVSRGIMAEQSRVGSDKFYLDISYKDPKFIKERFPMIYGALLVEGYDLTRDWIPVYPCQHYLMGGIDVDLRSATTVDRLYACGECSHTGVHGANRLASNSLLEALVFSHAAAEDINRRSRIEPATFPRPRLPCRPQAQPDPQWGCAPRSAPLCRRLILWCPTRSGRPKASPGS